MVLFYYFFFFCILILYLILWFLTNVVTNILLLRTHTHTHTHTLHLQETRYTSIFLLHNTILKTITYIRSTKILTCYDRLCSYLNILAPFFLMDGPFIIKLSNLFLKLINFLHLWFECNNGRFNLIASTRIYKFFCN